MADNEFRSDRERDPIAGFARLIGQADPPAGSALVDTDLREETASDCDDKSPQLPPAPQLPVGRIASEQAYELDPCRQGDQAYDVDYPPCAADEEHQNEVPRASRRSPVFVMAILGLALVGTAGASGYRYISGGSVQPKPLLTGTASNKPNKIMLAPSETQAKDGPATTGSIENSVSAEEQPATSKSPKAAPPGFSPRPKTPAAPTKPAGRHAESNQAMPSKAASADPPAPTRNSTAASHRPGESNAADITAAPEGAHVAVASIAPADANAKAVTPPVLARGYAVQVTSERSERRAQAAFRALQGKYPNQLSGRQMVIRRVDLGAAGTYYRALIGPFASAEKAAKLCSGLKAAGGDCIVQKN